MCGYTFVSTQIEIHYLKTWNLLQECHTERSGKLQNIEIKKLILKESFFFFSTWNEMLDIKACVLQRQS